MSKISWEVKPGGLSAADHERIISLAPSLSSGQIAQKLGKHPGTVAWFMYRQGLKGRRSTRVLKPYYRKGVLVRPFCADEDKFIEEARSAGDGLSAIAAAIRLRFGYERAIHSIHNRLTMLASYEEASLSSVSKELAA